MMLSSSRSSPRPPPSSPLHPLLTRSLLSLPSLFFLQLYAINAFIVLPPGPQLIDHYAIKISTSALGSTPRSSSPPPSSLPPTTTTTNTISPQDQFIQALQTSLASTSFVKLLLKDPMGVGKDEKLKMIQGRVVDLKKGPCLQLLYRYETRDETKNHGIEDSPGVIERLLSQGGFRSARLFTTEEDVVIGKGGNKLERTKPTFTSPPPTSHDRTKKRMILPPMQAMGKEGETWLERLGVLGPNGEPRRGMAGKHRQIQKFVEILSSVVEEANLSRSTSTSEGAMKVVDMGAGKGYLTFATYEYLKQLSSSSKGGRDVEVVGVELRPELVESCNALSRAVGFGEGLRFVPGAIASIANEEDVPRADVVIALHACDTATDDALLWAVRAGARAILTAPCCHKEVRKEMVEAATMAGQGQSIPLELRDVIRHGILLERQAEIVTDSLRALLLELAGYKAQVFEFISGEHTAKNLMITAVKRPAPLTPTQEQDLLNRCHRLMSSYGIARQRLADHLLPPPQAL